MVGAGVDARPWRAHGWKASGRDGQPGPDFSASLTELESHRLPAAVAQAQAAGIRLLTWDEAEYPQRLREIYDPPPPLYVLGNIELLNRHQISIVGSRRPTPYGNQMAERLARDLADRGVVIVSALARGLDSSAHKGALSSAAGATIGVLGCAIGVIYPKENKKIFAEMETRGAIISEFTMGTFPGPQNFPIAIASSLGCLWAWWLLRVRNIPAR